MRNIRAHIAIHVSFMLLFFFMAVKQAAAAGPYTNGSIGNLVWKDLDGDGIQDAGEPGCQQVQVLLLDGTGATVSTTVTDAAGNYIFNNVDAGTAGKTFQVWFKLPSGYRFSPVPGLTFDADNNDAHPTTGKTDPFTLLPGQSINDIDAGIVNIAGGTLPLHRLLLRASLSGNIVNLEFEAENEMNTSHFVVERSFDGQNFSEITTVAVSGPLNTPTEYNLSNNIQALLSYPVVYYRIKAEDNASRAAYSNIALVRLSKVSGIRVWPNPFTEEVRISYTGSSNTMLDVVMSDMGGKVAWSGAFKASGGPNQFIIKEADRLSSGIYFIRVTDRNTGQSFAERVVK